MNYPAHLGSLHAFETVLLVAIAFGPFVVLTAVVMLRRRREVSGQEASGDA